MFALLAMMDGVLVIGGLGFYILLAAASLLIFFSVEHEKPGFATATMVASFVLLAYFGGFNLAIAATKNPVLAAATIAAYFAVGVGWSVARWWFYVKNRRALYDELRQEFLESKGLPTTGEIPMEHRWAFKVLLECNHGVEKPVLKQHKGLIAIWSMYWPWSMTWTMINDPVKKAWRALYARLQTTYQAIADRAYKDTSADVEGAEPPPPAPREPQRPQQPRPWSGYPGGGYETR